MVALMGQYQYFFGKNIGIAAKPFGKENIVVLLRSF
jgi:hypothetical protein